MTINKDRKFFVVVLTLLITAISIPMLSDLSQPKIVNHVVLDAWCEEAWNDMITQKEDKSTDARLIGNMMMGGLLKMTINKECKESK